MRQQVNTVFRGQVEGTDPVYTDGTMNDLLGLYDEVAMQAVAQEVSGANVSLTLGLEQSNDGTNWVQLGPPAALNAAPLAPLVEPGDASTVVATAPQPVSLGYARIRIQLAGQAPSAYLVVSVCGRG